MTDELATPQRRYFIRTSNGDFMDMTFDSHPYAHVDVLTIDVDDDDEYFELAEQGAGRLLGRLVTIQGVPLLLYADRVLPADAAERLAAFLANRSD